MLLNQIFNKHIVTVLSNPANNRLGDCIHAVWNNAPLSETHDEFDSSFHTEVEAVQFLFKLNTELQMWFGLNQSI